MSAACALDGVRVHPPHSHTEQELETMPGSIP
jgi:hypothetical protein